MATTNQVLIESIDTITARLAVVNEAIAEGTAAMNDHHSAAREHRLRTDALKRERETLNLALRQAQQSQRVKSMEDQTADELRKAQALRGELEQLVAQAKEQVAAAGELPSDPPAEGASDGG